MARALWCVVPDSPPREGREGREVGDGVDGLESERSDARCGELVASIHRGAACSSRSIHSMLLYDPSKHAACEGVEGAQ